MVDILAEIEGAIADSLSASGLIQSSVAAIQSGMAFAQATLLESQYLAAIPIIIAEFKGLVNILQGSGELFIGTLESLAFFVPDAMDGIFTFFTFAISWMMCLFKNIANMQTCLFYYLLEVAGQILYLPIRLLLFTVYKLGLNFYSYETKFWNGMETFDRIFMNYLGFHITHYPKNIREQCYNCKRLKISALTEHTAPLVDDITRRLPENLMPGFMRIAEGGKQIMNPFSY
jgi:hypothetical protein